MTLGARWEEIKSVAKSMTKAEAAVVKAARFGQACLEADEINLAADLALARTENQEPG